MNQQRKMFVIGAGLALIVVFGGFLVYRSLVFRLVSITPSNHKLGTQEDIVFHFNKPLTADTQKQVSISPKITFTAVVQNTDIRIRPQGTWPNNKTFTITVAQATNKSGGKLTGLSTQFTTVYKDFGALSKSSQQQLIQQSDGSQLVNDDALRKNLPHYELEYTIDYKSTSGTKSNKPYYLIIDTNVSVVMQKNDSTYKSEAERIRNLALAYLQSKNIKPTDYPIYYSTPVLQSSYGTYTVY